MIKTLLPMLLGDAEAMQETVEGIVEQYRPLIYSVAKIAFSAYADVANNNELFTTVAAMKRNQYDAYVAAGFSEEQAMMFLINASATRSAFLKQFGNAASGLTSKE